VRNELAELWKFRGLLLQLVRRDLKVRYKNSRLGILWSLAPPLVQVLCISFAMRNAISLAQDFPSYILFVLVAQIPWVYFQTAILDSSQSILLMMGVIRKVYLPREIIPLANAISNFIHFLITWAVFFVFWFVFRGGKILFPEILWFPYLVIVQFFLVTGLSLFASALNVFYEDVKYIITIVLSFGFFLLPIIYVIEMPYYKGSSMFQGAGLTLYMLNPMAALMTGFRKSLLEPPLPQAIGGASFPLDVANLLTAGLISLLVLVGGYAYFNSRKWQFVERP
jgi:lipopolysaccharide transport system permease protein